MLVVWSDVVIIKHKGFLLKKYSSDLTAATLFTVNSV